MRCVCVCVCVCTHTHTHMFAYCTSLAIPFSNYVPLVNPLQACAEIDSFLYSLTLCKLTTNIHVCHAHTSCSWLVILDSGRVYLSLGLRGRGEEEEEGEARWHSGSSALRRTEHILNSNHDG